MRRILVILLFHVLVAPVRAQQNALLRSDMLVERYNMSRLDLTVGLPHDHVNDIFVDSRGFVWVSSYGGGAVRYDGYSFMAPQQGDSRSCLGFSEDRHQRLWIAYDEGAVVIDLKKMRRVVPKYGSHDIGSLLRRGTVRVYCDSKGSMWQVARDSIYCYEFDEAGDVASISRCRYQGNTPDITICDIENNGNVWVSTSLGLSRLHAQDNSLQFSPIHASLQTLKGLYITDMLRQGSLVWIATNQGLFSYDLYNSTLQSFRHSSGERSLSHNHVTSLALTSDSHLLVGTLRGICLFDSSRSDFVCWNSSTANSPLPSDFIRCLLNYDGQLWIGTETAGIVRLMPKPLLLQNYVHQPGNPLSLPSNPVNAMYACADGTLWVGNVEGGLSRLTVSGRSDSGFVHWTTANSALSHNSVSVLQPDAHGRLWIGTWGGGINSMVLKGNGQPQRLVLPADIQRQTDYIGALVYDRFNDALWIGSNDGIFLYDLKTGSIDDPFPDNRNIRGCIGACIDRRGHLWMGCLTGVCDIDIKSGRVDNGKFRYRHLRQKLDNPQSSVIDKITCIYETKDGTLWLGSDGYGLYCRTTDKDGKERFKVLTSDDGLANNAVKGVVDDDQGRLWITTNNGVSVYDPRQHTFINYGERDGLICQRFYWNSAIKGPDGTIYLGSMKGLTAIRGENADATYPVRLSFTHLVVDNQEITSANSSILDSDISQAEKIRLHESNKSFSLSFSTLSYAETPHFVCRLKGFEDEWTVLKPGEHTVRYTSLKPGTYVFEVKNSTEAGQEGQTISIEVEVTPYFWKSWWFVLLCLVALSAVFVWIYRLRMSALRRQEAEKLMQPVRKALEESDDPQQLQSRIQNILDSHEHLRNSLRRTVEADKQQQTLKYKSFMTRATEIMEQNYSNSEFGIDEFAEALGMSRSLVSKRLNQETGLSTIKFIRNYRLNVAKKLLLDNWANRNVTEIAYKVGFNDPKYFTRCFTRQYGCSPSSYAEEDK